MQFEFYVLNYNHTNQEVEMWNIFNNVHVQEYTEKAVKKYLRNPRKYSYETFGFRPETIYGFDGLVREIDSIIKWQLWSRFENEVSVGAAFEDNCKELQKIDAYYQAHANIRTITHEVIRQYKEQLKKGKG